MFHSTGYFLLKVNALLYLCHVRSFHTMKGFY